MVEKVKNGPDLNGKFFRPSLQVHIYHHIEMLHMKTSRYIIEL